ncbi:hypothetical protein WU83_19365, partial [Mycobacterium nebraskense]
SACNRCTGDTLFDTDVVLLPSDLPVFEGTYVRILLHRGRDTTDRGVILSMRWLRYRGESG